MAKHVEPKIMAFMLKTGIEVVAELINLESGMLSEAHKGPPKFYTVKRPYKMGIVPNGAGGLGLKFLPLFLSHADIEGLLEIPADALLLDPIEVDRMTDEAYRQETSGLTLAKTIPQQGRISK